MYTTRENCRICSGDLKPVLSLGDISLSTFIDDPREIPKAPLSLVRCVDCNLYQLEHTVDQDALYREYWYQSGLNASMRQALADVVQNALRRTVLAPNDVVLDIGANDGTLLEFYPEYAYKVAFEPSNVGEKITSADVVFHNYFTAEAYPENLPKAKIITAIAMFYDLEDPNSFVADLKAVLHEEGTLIIQMMDLMSMFKTGDFPNLCHEHLEYYSLDVLQSLLLRHDLEIYDLEYNKVNGGSLRVYVKHAEFSRKIEESVPNALIEERNYFKSLGNADEYFQWFVSRVRSAIQAFVLGANLSGQKVAVLGASTKGNTLLQYFNLDSTLIDHASEVNPDKFGKYTVATNIPIVSEEESLKCKPDYYLVLPWGFTDFFVQKFDQYLRDGGMFIVPLPIPKVIRYSPSEVLVSDVLL